MSDQTAVQQLNLTDIAHLCDQETGHFFRRQSYDPRYCFELFRRAIEKHSQHAWEFVYTQYRSLVVKWVERHAAFSTSGEEAQYFANRAFEKMWNALTPERFARFSSLKSLLRYLQMCAHSAILDHVRAAENAVADAQIENLATEYVETDTPVERKALERLHRREFWDQIDARLYNDKERQVMYGCFVLALKPREICDHFWGAFSDVNEVYRIKENVLARLRRDPGLTESLYPDA
ncbi:MAG: sigma-70 family RNA polymerase sigma factor [Anaerolineae bacterium]|nr:sigma-70 family RNA polymerase sigma factor [Anaerolineae bacterium]